MIRLDVVDEKRFEQYEEFVRSRPDALFYHSIKYKGFLASLFGCNAHYLIALEDGQIVGALPMMYLLTDDDKKLYNSLPFFGSNGGILFSSEVAVTYLIDTYNDIAKSEDTIGSTIISNPLQRIDLAKIIHNYTDHRIGQFTDIEIEGDPREILTKAIDSSAKRNVKKALREGISVEVDNSQLDKLHEMHHANIISIGGLPKSTMFFQSIKDHFIAGKDFNLYVAKKDGRIIAGLLLFYYNKVVEYFTPAIDDTFKSIQPMALIIMEAMVDASKNSYKLWNWGGTWLSQNGVYRFKKKWGAVERPYQYFIQLNDLEILQWSKSEILKRFPNFYVLPFDELNAIQKER